MMLDNAEVQEILGVSILNLQDVALTHGSSAYEEKYNELVETGRYDPTVYARVLTTEDSHTIVQYWFFYLFNHHDIFSEHEGDWEMIQLVFCGRDANQILNSGASPNTVAYSQHTSGKARDWVSANKLDSHPCVYVAEGSHANFFSVADTPEIPILQEAQVDRTVLFCGTMDEAEAVARGIEKSGEEPVRYELELLPEMSDEAAIDSDASWLRYDLWGEVSILPTGLGPLGPASKEREDQWANPLNWPEPQACLSQSVTGSGHLITQTYAYSNFNAIEAYQGFQVELKKSSTFNIEITVDDNLLEYLEVAKSGNTLRIGLQQNRLYPSATLSAKIAIPDISKISLSGGSRVDVTGFDLSHDLSIELSDGSRINGDISATDVDLKLSGASHIELAGAVDNLVADGSGSSQLLLGGFLTKDASISLSDGGRATVNVSGTLNVSLSGGSHLAYMGEPKLGDIDVSGGSSIGME
jgi:hypothetical protein